MASFLHGIGNFGFSGLVRPHPAFQGQGQWRAPAPGPPPAEMATLYEAFQRGAPAPVTPPAVPQPPAPPPRAPPIPPPPPMPPTPARRNRNEPTENDDSLPQLTGAPSDQVVQPHKDYHPQFLQFMRYTTGRQHNKNATFSPQYLKTNIKPHHVVNFFHYKAYGKERVDYKRDKPTMRVNGMLRFKTAISHYMPLHTYPWDGEKGNPTRAGAVNKVIAAIRDAECKGRGKKSQARRELSETEYRVTKPEMQC